MLGVKKKKRESAIASIKLDDNANIKYRLIVFLNTIGLVKQPFKYLQSYEHIFDNIVTILE